MISVIVVSYNRKDLLKRCLDSIKRQNSQDVEIIVVDNGSSDNSKEMIRAEYPGVKLMSNTKNLLFCKAYNQGIDVSKGDFILCLNNDVILDKDYLKETISIFRQDEKIGMVSGKILRIDGKIIDSTGLFLGRNRKAVERGYGIRDEGQYDTPEYVFGVSGACAFFRRNLLKDIKDEHGYFDERFEMYYEDLDLCWRAQKKGWKAYYNPKAIAYHMRAGTAVAAMDRKGPKILYLSGDLRRMYIRNRYLCMKKNDSKRGILVNLPFILFYELKIWCYLVFLAIRKGIRFN